MQTPRVIHPTGRRPVGFSLTELLFVVAIIGLLGAFVLPSFVNRIQAAKRSEAAAVLMDIAGEQEKFFLINNRYTDRMAGS